MLEKFSLNDNALNQGLFLRDEVQYNLMHRICDSESSTCLKSSDGQMMYAQSEGHNGWLWISNKAADDTKKALLQELLQHLEGKQVQGLCGDPLIVEMFINAYTKLNGVKHQPKMLLESYLCPEVRKPLEVRGTLQKADMQDVETIAEFLAGFLEWAFGTAVDPSSQIAAAEATIEAGNLYLWIVEGAPVSMANIAHRSPRHARINDVYTPPAFRKKGYASAIVAELCTIIQSEGLVPMLYADLKNPDSNKIYKNVGFVESGKIADIGFV
ncbi:GNAT family N-acetyltransferase [Paenibacillus eucommiae]|uniref:GNAT family acetyltransferase n=1 Tax=Paenibacillus eucommiae TaxID=1355755 RepID=A0ABS4ITY7_9BACL|nr:GNAT family N-acetyltransferase [Paenibacillus eucommiae]MBP1990973.1 putative GNAT family acetyltransferase [Paenibacillus eucommiae]